MKSLMMSTRVFLVNFEHISYLFLVFLLITLSMYLFAWIFVGDLHGFIQDVILVNASPGMKK